MQGQVALTKKQVISQFAFRSQPDFCCRLRIGDLIEADSCPKDGSAFCSVNVTGLLTNVGLRLPYSYYLYADLRLYLD